MKHSMRDRSAYQAGGLIAVVAWVATEPTFALAVPAIFQAASVQGVFILPDPRTPSISFNRTSAAPVSFLCLMTSTLKFLS